MINLSNRAKEQALTNDVAGDDDKLASSISVEDLSTSSTSMKTPGVKASVNTVNQRLIEEIQRSQENQVAPKTAAGKKSKEIFSEFRSKASDEERERRIEEARNLNGVNPLIALGGSVVALGGSAFLWYCTRYLAALFASHPITTDIYSLQRLFAVFRNGVMGLISLASGFFGVTGVGLFLLGARVAYGVAIGELDPTPIKRSDPLTGLPETKSKIPNIWDFMVGKKSKDGSNPFL